MRGRRNDHGDEAGTVKAAPEYREAIRPIMLNANDRFPPTATSTVTIFSDRFRSTPAVRISHEGVAGILRAAEADQRTRAERV
jgi:hypothetical protein